MKKTSKYVDGYGMTICLEETKHKVLLREEERVRILQHCLLVEGEVTLH